MSIGNDRWGETPCAFVVLRAGEAATAEELIGRMEGRVHPRTAAYFMRDAGSGARGGDVGVS